jgi:hypothetical protein
MCMKKKKVKIQERLPPLNERISYVANGLYGMETDENGRFICASEKLKDGKNHSE